MARTDSCLPTSTPLIYWTFSPSKACRDGLLLFCLSLFGPFLLMQSSLYLLLTAMALISGLFKRWIKVLNNPPLALSYDLQTWRLIYRDQILTGSLNRGFVLATVAFLEIKTSRGLHQRVWLTEANLSIKAPNPARWSWLRVLINSSRNQGNEENKIKRD